MATRKRSRDRRLAASAFAAGVVLLAGLALGPLGCGTLVGYGIGGRIDGSRFADLPAPYPENLTGAAGRPVRMTTRSGHAVSGRLLGVASDAEGEPVGLIESGRRTAMPGGETRVDTVAVASILSAQVARDGHAYRDAGFFVGAVTDATVLCLVFAALRNAGEGASK